MNRKELEKIVKIGKKFDELYKVVKFDENLVEVITLDGLLRAYISDTGVIEPVYMRFHELDNLKYLDGAEIFVDSGNKFVDENGENVEFEPVPEEDIPVYETGKLVNSMELLNPINIDWKIFFKDNYRKLFNKQYQVKISKNTVRVLYTDGHILKYTTGTIYRSLEDIEDNEIIVNACVRFLGPIDRIGIYEKVIHFHSGNISMLVRQMTDTYPNVNSILDSYNEPEKNPGIFQGVQKLEPENLKQLKKAVKYAKEIVTFNGREIIFIGNGREVRKKSVLNSNPAVSMNPEYVNDMIKFFEKDAPVSVYLTTKDKANIFKTPKQFYIAMSIV